MTREEIWVIMALAAAGLVFYFWRRFKEDQRMRLFRESPCLKALVKLNARQVFERFDENYLIEFSCANRFRFERFDFDKAALSAVRDCPGFYEGLVRSCLTNRRKLSAYEKDFKRALLLSGSAAAAQKLGASQKALRAMEARAWAKMKLSAPADFNIRVRVYFGPRRRKRFKEALYRCGDMQRLFRLRDEMGALEREKRALARFQTGPRAGAPSDPRLLN